MRPATTPQLRQVLARGSFDAQWTMDVFYDGLRRMQDVPVTNVQINEDGTAKVQQSGSLVIVWQDPQGKSIAPRTVDDILSPFGTALRLYQIISTGPLFTERVPMGSFVISDTPTIESVPWSFNGRILSKGDRIKVTFKDPFYKVQRNRFDVPGVTPSLTSVYAEIQRLTRLPITRNPLVPDGPIPRAMVYEEDRLDAVYELANVLDALPYMMADGTVSLRPKNWTPVVDTIAAANAGADPADISPASYTAWTEQARNLIPTPNPTVYAGSGWATSAGAFNAPKDGEWLKVVHTSTVTGYWFTDGIGEAIAVGDVVTLAVQYRVDAMGTQAATHVRVTPHRRSTNSYFIDSISYLPIVVGKVETVMLQWTATVAMAADDLDIAIASATSTGGFATVSTGWGWSVRRPTIVRGAVAVEPFSGDTQPGGGLQRTRYVGTANASPSVLETRQIIPAVPAPHVPSRGTLIGVGRGMSAEGVYNRVVVRAQGQQAGVLAADEIVDGPLRAANVGDADSPFGRVPYFLSSQFITTIAQAVAEVRKWLPRVSRPQAAIMDIEEVLNPLREVGDVVTIMRVGETFPARVVKVRRTSAKTQVTSVMVVPSA